METPPGSGNYYPGVPTDNTVTVQSGTGTDASNVYGAYDSASIYDIKNNIINMSGGTVGVLYGGRSYNGIAQNNAVHMSGGTAGTVYGGYSSFSSPATGNTVTIANGQVNNKVYGGFSMSGDAGGNTVTMTGGAVIGDVIGGLSAFSSALGNTVTISGGTINGELTGGSVNSFSGTVTGNTVIISGTGTVNRNVFGGASIGSGDVTGNTVIISGAATVNANKVVGGFSDAGAATGNTIRIEGTPTFDPASTLYGGGTQPPSSADARTGNTLEMWTKGITVGGLQNFQKLYFYLPSTIANNDTVLTVNSAVDIATPTSGPSTAPTIVGVGIEGGAKPSLAVGDVVTLIKVNSGNSLTADATIPNTTTGMQGISRAYTFALSTTASTLDAQVSSIQATSDDIRKSPSEGRASSAAFLTQGGDLAAGQGMNSAWRSIGTSNGWGAFGATSGGQSRFATGSHVDVSGGSAMLGLAKRFTLEDADLVAGPFFEAGLGSYDSYNGDSVHARGDTSYQGGGLLARIKATRGAARGLYAEASGRGGTLYTTYRSNDLNPGLGRAEYTTDTGYIGAHGGLGYVWDIDEKTALDMYGKYFWTRTEGTSVTILGDNMHFEVVDSQRLVAGARLSREIAANIRPYVGAAWNDELDGDARSTLNGESVAAPSLSGTSGMGEVGLEWTPARDSGFSLDLGAQGYLGVREGWSGTLQVKYEF